jgi:hypothetical protein
MINIEPGQTTWTMDWWQKLITFSSSCLRVKTTMESFITQTKNGIGKGPPPPKLK